MTRFLLGLFLGAIAAGIVIALNEGDPEDDGATTGADPAGYATLYDGTNVTASNSQANVYYSIWPSN